MVSSRPVGRKAQIVRSLCDPSISPGYEHRINRPRSISQAVKSLKARRTVRIARGAHGKYFPLPFPIRSFLESCSCSHLQPSREAIDGFVRGHRASTQAAACLTSARTEDRYTPNTPSGDCETMGYGNFTMKHISKILSPHPVTSPQPF
jgi:hypothetical protein